MTGPLFNLIGAFLTLGIGLVCLGCAYVADRRHADNPAGFFVMFGGFITAAGLFFAVITWYQYAATLPGGHP